jgi:hypothetical protein
MSETQTEKTIAQSRAARIIFTVAGIWGVLIVVPLYFLESSINNRQPPSITHPEYYYGFIGGTLVWQFVYILVGGNPTRYRPVMILGILAKTSYWLAVLILFLLGRVPKMVFVVSLPDLVLAVLFAIAYWTTRVSERKAIR